MKKWVLKSVRNIPFILLGVDFLQLLCYTLEWYPLMYHIADDITGHSLLTTFYMGFYAYLHRKCAYTWAALVGLFLLNTLNLIAELYTVEYYSTYAFLCYAIVIVILLITKLKRI